MGQVRLKTKRRSPYGMKKTIRQVGKLPDLAGDLADAIVVDAQFRVPKQTWALHDSIAARKTGHGTWEVKVGKHYGVYVEYGTRHMAAQPYFRPAIDAQMKAFKRNFRNIFRENV